MNPTSTLSPQAARQKWMAVLARASADELAAGLAVLPALPEAEVLRAPETGLVMVRGRAGGDGDAFNLGEMTVTRCAIRLGCISAMPMSQGAIMPRPGLPPCLMQPCRMPHCMMR